MKRLGACFVVVLVLFATALAAISAQPSSSRTIEFLFTSDAHYGITRAAFRGGTNVAARVVNAAMIEKMNGLPRARLPKDGGAKGGELVGPIDFVAEGGDIANREESAGGDGDGVGGTIQPAAVSWSQFRADYVDRLRLTDA